MEFNTPLVRSLLLLDILPVTRAPLARARRLRHAGRILRHGRRERAPRPDARAVLVEDDGDGHEGEGDEAEEGASPIDAEGFEHVLAEEGEDGPGDGTKEGVCCDGGGSARRGVRAC